LDVFTTSLAIKTLHAPRAKLTTLALRVVGGGVVILKEQITKTSNYVE
jgi:hypothetical protein